MIEVTLRDEFIKLGQALKVARLCDMGSDAKEMILEGRVKVNGEVDLRRGRKLYEGDLIEFEGETVKIVK